MNDLSFATSTPVMGPCIQRLGGTSAHAQLHVAMWDKKLPAKATGNFIKGLRNTTLPDGSAFPFSVVGLVTIVEGGNIVRSIMASINAVSLRECLRVRAV